MGVLQHTYETTSYFLCSFQKYASWTAKEYRLVMSCPLTPVVKEGVANVGHCAGSLVSDTVGKQGCTWHTQWLLAQVQQAALTPGSKHSARRARAAPVPQAAAKSESLRSMSQLCSARMHACVCHVRLPCAVQLDCHGCSLHSKELQQAHAFKDACLLSAQAA